MGKGSVSAMAGYQGAEAYDFSLFEPKNTVEAVQAEEAYRLPAKKKQQKTPDLKVLPRRTRQQEKMLAIASFKRVLVALLVSAVLFGAIVLQIASSVRRDTLERRIESVSADIRVANSENVRLASAIDGMFSIENVESFATGVLGMSKLEDYQIEYVDLSTQDTVLYSGAQAENTGFFGAVLAYLESLFA